MKQVSIDEVKNDLPGYLQLAEKESVVITGDRRPVGILIGLKEGKGISIEKLRAKYVS